MICWTQNMVMCHLLDTENDDMRFPGHKHGDVSFAGHKNGDVYFAEHKT